MSKKHRNILEIISYTDPYCTWCWGSEPVFRKIEQVYGNQIGIRFVMGGLVPDIKDFFDSANNIGGKDFHKQVAEHWLDASFRHGMPVDEKIFYDIKDVFTSTYPANIAFKSAQIQDEEKSKKFLRRLREAASAERKNIQNIDVQVELARDVNLDAKLFLENIENGKAEEAFSRDLEEIRQKGVRGFPTFLIHNFKGDEIMLRGFNTFDNFQELFLKLAGHKLKPKTIAANEAAILAFIENYAKVSLKEICEVFDLSKEKALSMIESLSNNALQGRLQEQKAGTGSFYFLKKTNPLLCETDTGICSTV